MTNPESPIPSPGEELNRLRWRCRRGMRELDRLLLNYLEQRYPEAGVAERASFARLLEQEDHLLWRWMARRERPEDAELHELIEHIRALAH